MKNNIRDFLTYSSSQIFMILTSISISAVWARYATVKIILKEII